MQKARRLKMQSAVGCAAIHFTMDSLGGLVSAVVCFAGTPCNASKDSVLSNAQMYYAFTGFSRALPRCGSIWVCGSTLASRVSACQKKIHNQHVLGKKFQGIGWGTETLCQ
jgi:hypothetical protein